MPRHERVPRQYEMMILIAPTVTEEGLPAVVDRVAGLVTEQGGTVARYTYENPWGRRRLAYPIQNFNDAYYVLYYFTAPPAAIEELERLVRLDDVIIRHLIVKYDPLTERYSEERSPFDPLPETEPEVAVESDIDEDGEDDGDEADDEPEAGDEEAQDAGDDDDDDDDEDDDDDDDDDEDDGKK